jgi:large subunit ribosomal protein L32
MAVPKKRTSKPRKRMRRSHHFLVHKAATMDCDTCGEVKLRHHVCPSCGSYRGQQVTRPRD